VDNGSTDDTAAAISGWAGASAVPLQALSQPRPGKSRALNLALRAAKGDLLALTDDDCRLHPEYVNDLLRHDAADTGLVLRGGRVELGNPSDLPFTINTSPTGRQWNRAANSARHGNIAGTVIGCNMTMRRALPDRLGLFDEDFGPGSLMGPSEDTDYVFRAYLAGATLEYVPDMTVFHHHGRKTAAEIHELFRGYMTGRGGIIMKYLFKHPNLCRQAYWDMRRMFREIVTGTNLFIPQVGFSHCDQFACMVRGASRYVFSHKDGVPSDTLG
jgi:GT2 family glycosyltransferase